MIIGLDYDGTYTRDPALWGAFICQAQAQGHTVHLVTMRYPSECVDMNRTSKNYFDPFIRSLGVKVHATSRKAKAPFMLDQGIKVTVWIDDNPKAVDQDATQIWPGADIAPEGSSIDPARE